MIAWLRRRIGRRRELDIIELVEFSWRAAILVSVLALFATPWVWLWRLIWTSPAF